MNGIKMSDCRFYVNEDARTVVCVIPPVIEDKSGNRHEISDMVFDFIRENFQYSDIDMYDAISFWNKRFGDRLTMPRSFVGKAKCMPDDEWDEELGKKIAFAKAKDKCYKSFFRRANLFVQAIDRRLGDMIDAFNNFGMKLDEKRENLQDQINDGLGIEEVDVEQSVVEV